MTEQFEQKVQQHLQESISGIDAATLSKLNQARQAALNPKKTRRLSWSLVSKLIPAAAVAMLVISVVPSDPTLSIELNSPAWVLYSDQDELALYENAEFYEWFDMVEASSRNLILK